MLTDEAEIAFWTGVLGILRSLLMIHTEQLTKRL